MLPSLPDAAHKLVVALGLGAFIAATTQPTSYYEQWEDLRAEREKQDAILEIERAYLEQLREHARGQGSLEENLEVFLERERDLGIQSAELQWLSRRAEDARDRWEKASFWSYLAGLGGLVAIWSGIAIWFRRDAAPRKSSEP